MKYLELFKGLMADSIQRMANGGIQDPITDEQIAVYQKLTIEERFEWIEAVNEFLFAV